MTIRPGTKTIWTDRALLGAVGVLAVLPYVPRLAWPSLYIDDLVRVAFRQTETLGESLFRPFNEHLAPLFEVVGWLAWRSAGEDPGRAASSFVWASFVPFALTVGLLFLLARREFGDVPTSATAAAVFALSELSNEVVFWYSASSFAWALLFTLGAWWAALNGLDSGSRGAGGGWAGLSAVLAFMAPCFSALGVLAGPAATTRGLLGTPLRPRALAPLLGTLGYVGLTLGLKHQGVVASSIGANLNLREGLIGVIEAPGCVLLPAVFGLADAVSTAPREGRPAFSLIVAGAVAVWLRFDRGPRPVVATSAVLILGGYGLTYPFRAAGNLDWILAVQRYHYFPQAGIALILAAASLRLFRAIDARGAHAAPALALATTVALLLIHGAGIRRHGRFYRFPEQPRTLAAMREVPENALALGLDRSTVLEALDPLRNAWTPDPRLFNTWRILPTWDATPRPVSDPRRALLAEFSAARREALCGGMDATRRLRTDGGRPGAGEPGEVVSASRARPLGDGRYESEGVLAFVEIRWRESGRMPAALVWDEPAEGELWWTDERGEWSPSRSLTWAASASGRPFVLPLEEIPHWTRRSDPRIRLLVRVKEPRILSIPALVR